MVGFTLLIEVTPSGDLNFESHLLNRDNDPGEMMMLEAVNAAVVACITEVAEAQQAGSGARVRHDAQSDLAARVFRETLVRMGKPS